jgi:hypothetical protein
MALDTAENPTANWHNSLRPTPFEFDELRLNDDLSFYVQKVFLNNIQFTRVIFVDKITQKSLASLSGLESNTNFFCEIGAVTGFISNDAVTFYYVDPAICDIDTLLAARLQLQINSEIYHHKKELFIDILNEYRKMYIRDEFYSSQLVCDWINWSIQNITAGVLTPINEFRFDNGTEITNTDTVIVSNETSNKAMSYAAVAAAAPRATQSKAASTSKSTIISSNKPTLKIEPKLKAHKKQSNKPIILEKIQQLTNKSKASALIRPSTTSEKFSFLALAISSDDESDDGNIQRRISKSTPMNTSRRRNANKPNKKREDSYDEDKFLDAICAQLSLTQTESATIMQEFKAEEKIERTLHNAAAKRSEALSIVMLSLGYLVITPPILNMLGGIVNNTRNDVDSNNRLKNPLVFVVFSALCISQVLCALFASKQIVNSSIAFVNNHPAFNSVLFGYEAAKRQQKSNGIMHREDRIEAPRILPSMKL